MATQERKMTDYIAYIIDELESVGYEPNPVPKETFIHQKTPDNFINMIWWDENGNAESTKCIQLNLGALQLTPLGALPLTRDYYDDFVERTKKSHSPKMEAMSKAKRVEREAKIAIMNKECGLVDIKKAANRYRKMLKAMETNKTLGEASSKNVKNQAVRSMVEPKKATIKKGNAFGEK